MEFLAGIIVAWAIVYGVICVAMVLTYLSFGRNREYLSFGVVCLLLLVHSMARAAHYLADDYQGVVLPGRIVLASLPMAAVALFHMGLGRREQRPAVRSWTSKGTGVLAALLAGVALAGRAVDYAQPQQKSFTFFFGEFRLLEYSLTVWGTSIGVFSLVMACGGCLLFMRSEREDRLVHTFFVVALIVLVLLAVNDLLLAKNLIRSVYSVEHGFLFLVLVVVSGFLRQFERSRQALRDQAATLREANRDLEKLASDLIASSEQLDRATDETRRLRPIADLGRLSASLAHEIRNPLAVISNVSASLRRHGGQSQSSTSIVTLVEMLQEETGRLARLVDDLLLFSQSGRQPREPIEATTLVDAALHVVAKGQLAELDGRVVAEVEPGLAPLAGNPDGLSRALVNLIINAIQSTDEDESVCVVAQRDPAEPGWVLIGVKDEGGGVPEDLRGDIFEPFFSTRPTGTGLGLPIVKSIVEAHGGTLELENVAGQGATFWMRLPHAKAERGDDVSP
ncbi:MAG: HAMP domain-containing histidine kinase [Deltaproteobacteria bacterium]|nr:HAMP domain-containing histidine kinase [Deltaproteobacteria bacterium]